MPNTLGLSPSFGFGDRIGLATPGHVRAMLKAGNGIEPIFPQQSIREMTRTQRTPEGVMGDAMDGMRAAGVRGVLNFAPAAVQMTGGAVAGVDLAVHLEQLSFRLSCDAS